MAAHRLKYLCIFRALKIMPIYWLMHINALFQQLEKLPQSVPSKSAISIPSQSSPITETMANRVIDEYKDKKAIN